jgi:hypothetical protein
MLLMSHHPSFRIMICPSSERAVAAVSRRLTQCGGSQSMADGTCHGPGVRPGMSLARRGQRGDGHSKQQPGR